LEAATKSELACTHPGWTRTLTDHPAGACLQLAAVLVAAEESTSWDYSNVFSPARNLGISFGGKSTIFPCTLNKNTIFADLSVKVSSPSPLSYCFKRLLSPKQ
jgi:hypothetical protein